MSAQIEIDGKNMPPLRGLNLFEADFYKDVAPTALGKCVPMSYASYEAVATDAIIKKVFNDVPVP